MIKVILKTADGQPVYEGTMPDFEDPPKVVIWQNRCFDIHTWDDESVEYRKCFAHWLE